MRTKEQTRSEGHREAVQELASGSPLGLQRTIGHAAMARMQRAAGNQAALRYLQRKCACNGSCASCKHQPEPTIGAIDERRHGGAQMAACSTCMAEASSQDEGKEANKLQRQETAIGPAAAPPIVGEVLNSPGSPLDSSLRASMERSFGHDFSGVRVHIDKRAAESAHSVNALAYTVGQQMVFAPGKYAPETPAGKLLLAHELTHVAQQKQWGGAESSAPGPAFRENPPLIACGHSAAEREADWLAHRVMAGQSVAGRRLATPAGHIHRSVTISPTDPAAPVLLAALTRLTGLQATAAGGTLALGAAAKGGGPASASVTSYVQRAIAATRAYTLQSGTTTAKGTAVRGVRWEAAASGTGITITINTADIGEFTWTADELVSEGFVNAVSGNDRTTATFLPPPAPGAPNPPVTWGVPGTNLDDLLATPLPFTNASLRSQALALIKQRVPAVAKDVLLEVEVDTTLQGASGVTLAEILRGLETNTPYRMTQSITGDRVEATYIDPRMTPGTAEQQRIPQRKVTFLAGPGKTTPSGAPVSGAAPCSTAALAEITAHLGAARTLITNTISLLNNSSVNLDAPLRKHFGPTGPANRARIAANYRLILTELTLERHGWICTPRGSGSGCDNPNVTGRTGPALPLVQLCIETSSPLVPKSTTVLHEVVHSSGIGSLTAGTEKYSWQAGYPGSDPLHNADSYAQFPADATAAAAAPVVPQPSPAPTKVSPTPSPAPSSSSQGTPPPLLQRAPVAGTETMHHELAESFRRSHGLPPGGKDEFGAAFGPSDAEIVYGALWFPLELSELDGITPWDLAHTPPERLIAPAGSKPPAAGPTYDDYARARRIIRFLQNLKNLTYDYETDRRPAGREPSSSELQILDSNLNQLLSTFNVRALVKGPGGRGLPTAPGGTTASLAGRARIVDSLGDFGGKRYQLERWAGADRFMNIPAGQLDGMVRAVWADPAVGVAAAPGARVTTPEKVAVAWFQGVMGSFLEPAFYHPGEDKFYLSSYVDLNTLEGQDTARHETVHLLGGRENTRQAFIKQFGNDWKKYWKPFEEGMAEFVNISSRTPAQIPPSAAGGGGTTSGYTGFYKMVQKLMALPGVGRDAVLQAYFRGRIPLTMFQQWQKLVDAPP